MADLRDAAIDLVAYIDDIWEPEHFDLERMRYWNNKLRAALTASPAGDDPKALDAAARSSSTEAVEQEVERLRYILFLFREFWFQNVTQTKIGSGHHHPMWQTVAEALGSMNQRTGTTPEEWQFITGHNKPLPAPSLPGKEEGRGFRCKRCGMSADEARAAGCVRGPCPMEEGRG